MSRRLSPAAASVALCLAWLGATPVAHAWTEAHVRTAQAHVDVQRDGTALVALTLDVRVRGGWLEGLEITGLDPDLELVEQKPPWLHGETSDGRLDKRVPRARVRDGGRVQLRFTRRAAPPRGEYEVGLVYRTDLAERGFEAERDGVVRVKWTLPGWRSGLDGVEVSMLLPPGAEAAQGDDDEGGVHNATRTRRDLGSRTLLVWRRVHLPRTMPWTLEARVPEQHVDPTLRYRPPETPEPPEEQATAHPADAAGHGADETAAPEPTRRSPLAPWLLVAAVALSALARRAAHHAGCRRARVAPRPWLPLPDALAVPLVLGAAATAGWIWHDHPLAGLAVLGLVPALACERTAGGATPPRPGRWRDATAADCRRARRVVWIARAASLDLTTPLGWLALAGIAGGLVALSSAPTEGPPWMVFGLAWLVPIAFTGTRLHRPPTVHARLHALLTFASRLRLPLDCEGRIAMRPALHEDAHGRLQDARLRLRTPGRSEGLLRLDVALAAQRQLGGVATRPVLVVVTRRGSEAERRLRAQLPNGAPLQGPGGKLARTLPADSETLARIAGALTAPRPASVPSPLAAAA